MGYLLGDIDLERFRANNVISDKYLCPQIFDEIEFSFNIRYNFLALVINAREICWERNIFTSLMLRATNTSYTQRWRYPRNLGIGNILF